MAIKKHKITLLRDDVPLAFGISTPLRDYRLCFLLNRALNITLAKEGVIRILSDIGLKEVACYTDIGEELPGKVYLVSNKHENTYLIPAYRQADYIVLSGGAEAQRILDEFSAALRKISNIQSTFAIPRKHLNSIEID